MTQLTRKHLMDRLRRQRKQGRIASYFSPESKDSPHPGHWVGNGKPMESFEEFLGFAVANSVINGADREQLLKNVRKSVRKPVRKTVKNDTSTQIDPLDLAMQLLEDNARLMRQAVERLPSPVTGLRSIFKILLED